MGVLLPYGLLGLLTAIEGGEISLFIAGYLIGTGELAFLPTLVLVACALFIGDLVWYTLGPRIYRLPLIRSCDTFMARLDRHIKERPFTVALLARFSYGMHHALIARFKSNGIPVPRMARILATTGLIWLVVLGGLVTMLAEYTPEIKRYLTFVEYAFAGGFVVLVLLEMVVTKSIKKRL